MINPAFFILISLFLLGFWVENKDRFDEIGEDFYNFINEIFGGLK